MSAGLIILAAGGSSRLGQPKQLVQFRGESLLRRAAKIALSAKLQPIVVVLAESSFASEIEGLDFVLNPNWREGMGSSIRVGLEKIANQIDGVVILLCDQPLISAEFLDRLATTNSALAAAEYDGTIGVPAYFAAEFFEELMALRGGAKKILIQNRSEVEEIPCPEAAMDVDTLSDVERLRLAEEQQAAQAQQ